MIHKLTWYLAKTTLVSTFSLIAILLGIDALITFIVQAGQANANYTTWDALTFALWRLPSDLYLILPVCGFLGVLFGLGSLSANNELIAMRAAGCSLWQMCRGVLIGAAVFWLLALLLASYISPVTRHIAYYNANKAQNHQAVLALANQSWVKSGNQFVLIGQVFPGGRLSNVTQFTVDGQRLKRITQSPNVTVKDQQWRLHHPTMTSMNLNKITQSAQKSAVQPALLTTKLLKVLALNPQNMTITTLLDYIHYRLKNHLNANRYQIQLWNRFFQPLVVLILMLLALPFVFSPLRSAGVGMRLVVGLVVGFGFYILNQFASTFALISHLPPFLGAALPTILFGSLLMLLLWRLD